MWDERYANEEYAYGTDPNEFLKETLERFVTTGKILFPADGEGRNGVYAAKKGLEVFSFDTSTKGKNKAMKLAQKEHVSIEYQVGEFFGLPLAKEQFDAAALIYAHFPPSIRSNYHQKIAELILPGGFVIIEGFSTGHLDYRSKNPKVGGPDKIEMLFSTEGIKGDFPGFEIIQLEEIEIELNEGIYHNGKGKVIRFVGRKRKELDS